MGDSDATVESESLHERAYQHLCQALMQGHVLPGQKLTLRGLAHELGMSMSPVREAVGRLAALKAVQILPKRYILVVPLSAELYLEMVELRKLLEGHAAARASSRMSETEITDLESINQHLLKLAGDGKMQLCMQQNHRFHFKVYEASGSKVLLETIEQIWLRIGPSLNQLLAEEYDRDETSLGQGFRFHTELIKAIRERDVNNALAAVTGDISTSTEYLLDGLRRQSELSSDTVKSFLSN